MADIIQFPLTLRCVAHSETEWDAACMNALRARACPIMGERLPCWLCDAWHNHLIGRRRFGMRPYQYNWDHLWAQFVEVWLSYQPEWQRAVEVATRGESA